MEQDFPHPNEWKEPPKSFGIGPPPPDIVNPLDRLARRPRNPYHMPSYPTPFPSQLQEQQHDTMSLNFAPPPRSKINSLNSSSPKSEDTMKESNASVVVSEQDNVVVTDVPIKTEEGEGSEGELPPPPPPGPVKDSTHSEEGECDSDPEEGELGDGEVKRERKEYRSLDSRHRRDARGYNSPRDNVIPLVKKQPGPPIQSLDPVQRNLERIASKQSPLVNRSPSYRDRDFRERSSDWGNENRNTPRDDRSRSNGSYNDDRHRFPPRDNRNFDKISRTLDFRKDGKSMRPGDMPSLISLPPMPQMSSSKSKVPDFPPLSFGPSAGIVPAPVPHPIPHPLIPPPVPGAAWPPPPGPHPIPPPMPSRHSERPREEDIKFDDTKIKESFDMYHKAWESYYADMHKDRGGRSSHKNSSSDRRSRSPDQRYSGPPPPPHHPGIPGPFPGIPPAIPPHMMEIKSRPKESAWERGLKVSKKIREEVKRNEKSDEESEDSQPGLKLQSKIVMKENKIKSRSPSIPTGKSTRRLSPLSDGGASSNGHHGHHYPRLTPERYRGPYERKPPPPAEPKKGKVAVHGADAEWRDPWMRPNSPKDRKRLLSRSSSSSDSSSDDSSPHHQRSIEELKRSITLATRRRRAKKDAAKLKRLKEKLSPSEYELLTRKRSKLRVDLSSRLKESDSESDSDDSSSSSSMGGSPLSAGNLAGKLADSPTSPGSSPDFRYKDKRKTKEILMRQLQRVEKQLERKKKDDRRRHS